MKVSFFTLGCKVNQFETEAMIELLEKEGFEVVEPSDNSDIFIVNTCAVTGESDRKSKQIIKRCKKINPNALVAAVGCSTQLNSKKIIEETDVDIVIGTKNKSIIGKLIRNKVDKDVNTYRVDDFTPKENYEELEISKIHKRTRANIKIQDGCKQFCSYCIIPFVRGPIRSRKKDDIIKEIKRLARNNYKEVILNGIHISSYGDDLDEMITIADIIEEIENIEGIQRIRLGSLEPRIINDKFIKRISKSSKLCNHFHLSLQSGSNTVLKRMNRKYTKEEYNEKVDIIRSYYPLSGITTDIIVGFPQETDNEFNETFSFVKKIGFSKIHVFKFSPREGTKAANFNGQIDGSIKNARSKEMTKLGDEMACNFMRKFINMELEVLFETKKSDDFFEGLTKNYLKVLYKSDINIVNDIKKIVIKNIKDDYLIGN